VQNQKNELTARIDDHIQKVFDFRVRLDAAPAAVQQSIGRDQSEGGVWCRGGRNAEAADGRASASGSTGSLGPAGSDARSCEGAATRWRETTGFEATGIDGVSTGSD
jgi:hypothetical protein